MRAGAGALEGFAKVGSPHSADTTPTDPPTHRDEIGEADHRAGQGAAPEAAAGAGS